MLFIESAFVSLILAYSLYLRESIGRSWLASFLLMFIFGSIFIFLGRGSKNIIGKRDIYLIVTFGWVAVSFFGALPFFLRGAIPSFVNAFFETVSGFTTTGASVLGNIESLPNSILLWRSMTQWIGGMGIIVLILSILPVLGIGGTHLFSAEAPGVTLDKIKPRIKESSKLLWFIYLGVTIAAFISLKLGGMNFFDALNHSFTTVSTGGFSTKQSSIAFFHSQRIEYIISFFMLISSIHFGVLYLIFSGKWRKVLKNEELRIFLIVVATAVFLVFLDVYELKSFGFEESFRLSLFQAISIITTTGFTTYDYTLWPAFVIYLIFALMFLGGMTGSTAGGIKMTRHIILIKDSIIEFKKQLYPLAVIPIKLSGKIVSQNILYKVLAFIILYILICAFSVAVLIFMGIDPLTSVGTVVTSIGNIGPGLGQSGPSGNFAFLPDAAKMFLAFLMIVGRLELFSVLILFTPYFWKAR